MPDRHILIVAHGHPSLSKGGAELAAWHQFNGFRALAGWDAWLLARHAEPGLERSGAAFHHLPGGHEILFSADADPFLFASQRLRYLTHDLPQLLAQIRPDVVHLHHYVSLGIELIKVVRDHCPGACVVLTLHEYLAICNHNGQMLKTSGELCRRASPAECHLCMPGRSPQDYFLRERYVKSFLGLVDRFIAPSHFLKQRYVEWGLPAERIEVIENGLPEGAPLRETGNTARPRTRFGYFGQITPYKGVELLLQAYGQLPADLREQCSLSIHGGGHERFEPAFSERVEQALKQVPGLIRRPAYAPEELPELMAAIDWVVVPSIWWENSPLVIQEAFQHGRPVICADIGGMAEKVRHEVDGLHFRVSSATDLARTLQRAVTEPGLWSRLVAGITPPPSLAQVIERQVRGYGLAGAEA
ncbi:MAG: glycosyltransferase family 4 protein [Panacagrimonas sp.]